MGQFVGFVDSDDYIDADMYEIMHAESLKESADVTVCGMYDDYQGKIEDRGTGKEILVLHGTEAYQEFFRTGGQIGCSNCNMLFKKEVFSNLRYRTGTIGEDIELLCYVFHKTETVLCLNCSKYYYAHRENSVTTAVFSEKNLDILIIMDKMLVFIQKEHPRLLPQMYAYQAEWYIITLREMYRSHNKGLYKQVKLTIRGKLKAHYNDYIKNTQVYLIYRILLFALIIYCFRPMLFLYDTCAELYHCTLKKWLSRKNKKLG